MATLKATLSAAKVFVSYSKQTRGLLCRFGVVNFNMSKNQSTMSDGKKVSCDSEHHSGACPAVLFEQENCTRGLIVIQEWWGLNQQIQEEARDIGNKGKFTTIVPDLYRGKQAKDNEEAGHLMNNLDWPGAVKDIAAAVKKLKGIGCNKVGVTGFCMGGALTLAAAALVPEVDAAAPFYGIPGADLADLSKITIPLQCHFGKKDELAGFSSPADYNKLKEKCKNVKVFELHEYDAGHAFTNHSGPNYHKESCELALKRMIEFMQKQLA